MAVANGNGAGPSSATPCDRSRPAAVARNRALAELLERFTTQPLVPVVVFVPAGTAVALLCGSGAGEPVLLAEKGRSGVREVLTRREREVAELLAQGCSNKEIARRLSIETATVKNHVHHVLEKLDVPSRRNVASMLAPDVRAPHLDPR